jgi:hypothetical protein
MGTDFSEVDTVLLPWAARAGVHVFTTYRDDAVRTFDIPGRDGQAQCQVWVTPPSADDRLSVEVWHKLNGKRRTFPTSLGGLEAALTAARICAGEWLDRE